VLNPYPKPQLKGYVPSHNSRNPASRPTRYHQSIVDHAHQKQTKLMPFHHRVALLRSRYAKIASRSLSGGHVPLGAKHLWCHYFCKYRLAGQPLPPSATHFNTLLVL